MIYDSKTGKVLVSSKQLYEDVKKYLDSLTEKELISKMKKMKAKLDYLKARESR